MSFIVVMRHVAKASLSKVVQEAATMMIVAAVRSVSELSIRYGHGYPAICQGPLTVTQFVDSVSLVAGNASPGQHVV